MDLTSLFLQLYAGYQVDLTVVLPLCHRRHVQERLEKGGVGWLEAMVQGGRLKYADDVLELLHHCIEGKWGWHIYLPTNGLGFFFNWWSY